MLRSVSLRLSRRGRFIGNAIGGLPPRGILLVEIIVTTARRGEQCSTLAAPARDTVSTTYITGSFVDSDIRNKVRDNRGGQCIDRVFIRTDHDIEAVGAGGFGGYRANHRGLQAM